ncbi:MAG TPA: hypothetical protein VH041_16970 [Caldimonas sp.]|nr:hypothetical protein [Caldimonas sp.]HEX4235981.1 hypothetical protein [Caldimonas sp.]
MLLTSSFLFALVVTAVDHGRRRWTARLLAAAALLGIVFLALKGVEYCSDWQQELFSGPRFRLTDRPGPAPAGVELFYMLYFTMTGVHALQADTAPCAVRSRLPHAPRPARRRACAAADRTARR